VLASILSPNFVHRAISFGACGWLQEIIIIVCCDNTHWPVSMTP